MSTTQSYDARTIKGKKAVANSSPSAAFPSLNTHSGPTTFFLRSERELERSAPPRGRQISREEEEGFRVDENLVKTPSATDMAATVDSTFGVESLADTIHSAASAELSLSRTPSNISETGGDAGVLEDGQVTSRKRKVNPVHPRIAATGHRIISAEQQPSTHTSAVPSPVSLRSSESPFRTHLRRGSAASSINFNSQPLTPLRMSPQPASAMPSTPRSGSPKSFRLSDEEGSVADETGSQAVHSCSGGEEEAEEEEEEDDADGGASNNPSSLPQLVMPSIAIPARRPFTEQGKRMGRVKIMVVGRDGVGKTSLIRSICRVCEHIVHVDQPSILPPVLPDAPRRGVDYDASEGIAEVYASTRPYPSWWTDFEGRRMLYRRKSIGDGVLERNVCFVDTVGIDEDAGVVKVRDYHNASLKRTLDLQKLSDSEVVAMLSGEGGLQIDVVLWLFDAVSTVDGDADLREPQVHLLRALARCTNVVPLIGHSDSLDPEAARARKTQVADMLRTLDIETYSFSDDGVDLADGDTQPPRPPFLISSALSDDSETIDASVLMSSQYVQPLLPSELPTLVEHLFDPVNLARMRHLSATKFLLWRQNNLGLHIPVQPSGQPATAATLLLRSPPPYFPPTLPSVAASTGSLLEDSSKVLVPASTSSYYRSASPSAASEVSGHAGGDASLYAVTKRHSQIPTHEPPFREVRLAKWALDLHRSLLNESKRSHQRRRALLGAFDSTPSTHTEEEGAAGEKSGSSEEHNQRSALTITSSRPSPGRLGGALSIIDPRDPLGLLAFTSTLRRRGLVALQVAGGCGLVGAMVWWVVRNWAEVQTEVMGFVGLGGSGGAGAVVVPTPAVPAPQMRVGGGGAGGLLDRLWR